MNENVSLNIEAIAARAKEQWFKQRTKRKSWREIDLRQFIEGSVPSWIIIVALALFALSAPHTTKMFDMITPGWGGAGVFLCEFGLLYIAFRRKIESKRAGALPKAMWALEGLLFLTAILVNGSGALIAVVSSAGIATLSASTIWNGIGTMNIVAQVGLVLVPLAALIIPIGTVVAGEGLAAHILEGRQARTDLTAEWERKEQLEVYRSAYSYLLANNVNSRDAHRRAMSATTNLFHRQMPPEVLYVEGETASQSASVMPSANNLRTVFRTNGRAASPTRRQDARLAVQKHLEAHPEDAEKSSGQIAALLSVGRTIAWEELAKWKKTHSVQ